MLEERGEKNLCGVPAMISKSTDIRDILQPPVPNMKDHSNSYPPETLLSQIWTEFCSERNRRNASPWGGKLRTVLCAVASAVPLSRES